MSALQLEGERQALVLSICELLPLPIRSHTLTVNDLVSSTRFAWLVLSPPFFLSFSSLFLVFPLPQVRRARVPREHACVRSGLVDVRQPIHHESITATNEPQINQIKHLFKFQSRNQWATRSYGVASRDGSGEVLMATERPHRNTLHAMLSPEPRCTSYSSVPLALPLQSVFREYYMGCAY